MTIELTLLWSVAHRGQEITAPRLCGLLALLAGELRAGCGAGRLVDGLWPDEQVHAAEPAGDRIQGGFIAVSAGRTA
ncbi:hypothetical protein [Streptomyces sp. NPDC001537]